MDGGVVAQKGFRIQAIVTLLDALNRDLREWDEVEAEIETNDNKVDYGFYKDGRLCTIAQVKSTQNSFSQNDITHWLNELYSDRPKVDEYILVLAGNISSQTRQYINKINSGSAILGFGCDQKFRIDLHNGDVDELSKIYYYDLLRFMSANGLSENLSLSILIEIANLLLDNFQTLILHHKKWKCSEIEEFLIGKLHLFSCKIESKLIPLSVIEFDRGSKISLSEPEPEHCLDLRELFEDRYLKFGYKWEDVMQRLSGFIGKLDTSNSYKLHIEAGYTICFALGRMMDGKSGLHVNLIQKTLIGTQVWDIDPTSMIPDSRCMCQVEELGNQKTIAVVIGFPRDILQDVKTYILDQKIEVGKILNFVPKDQVSQTFVRNGDHSMVLAQYISDEILKYKADRILLFPSCPGSVCFMLGQISRPFRHVTMYEYDFNNRYEGSYFPTYTF